MARPNGRYKRLQELQELGQEDVSPRKTKLKSAEEEEEIEDKEELKGKATAEVQDEELVKKHSARARLLAKDDTKFFAIGVVGATLAGSVFPGWGVSLLLLAHLLFSGYIVPKYEYFLSTHMYSMFISDFFPDCFCLHD
mmetsp:Transcript_22438/g.33594  ORF Transcript_22438/g.33594 Transcript_22438/m.33594 type:complete len:139 (+) Transcript_22438:268-684(+)